MLRVIGWFQQAAKPRMLLLATVVYLMVAFGLMQPGAKKLEQLSGQPVKILDLQVGFTQEEAQTILAVYTPAARLEAARFLLWADTIYPLVYGMLIALLLAFLFRSGRFQYLVLLPLLAVLVDFAENYWLYQVLNGYPNEKTAWILWASVCNVLKWGLLGLAGLACLVGFGMRMVQRFPSVRKVAP